MLLKLEYDFVVKVRNQALAVVLALAAIGVGNAAAQSPTVRGLPPSVTSQGFGGHGNAPRGLPPSVTSLGFGRLGTVPTGEHHHRRDFRQGYGSGFYFPYAYPYVVDGPPSDSYDEDQYNGGPTVFDRRGTGTPTAQDDGYPPSASHQDAAPVAVQEAVVSPPTPTVLVFKDGHEIEIVNYAIVGTTLYDLSQERRWKIALSELDLPATVKQNDDRGLEFVVPANAQAN